MHQARTQKLVHSCRRECVSSTHAIVAHAFVTNASAMCTPVTHTSVTHACSLAKLCHAWTIHAGMQSRTHEPSMHQARMHQARMQSRVHACTHACSHARMHHARSRACLQLSRMHASMQSRTHVAAGACSCAWSRACTHLRMHCFTHASVAHAFVTNPLATNAQGHTCNCCAIHQSLSYACGHGGVNHAPR